jgi:Fic family protein
LLGGVRGADKSPGQIRQTQVHIGAGNRFTPPPTTHLTQLIGQLERDIIETATMDPLIQAFMVHYQFEAIHPFRDGNGRVGRLLLALMIYKCCGFDMPWLYLSEFFERNKDEYIDRLYSVSSEAAWLPWVRFCLIGTVEVGKSTITRVQALLAVKQSYEERIKNMNGRDRLIHLVPRLFSSPMLRYRDLQNDLNISYPTARDDIDAMVQAGILAELGRGGNPRTFFAVDIFNIAYGD